LAAAPITAIVVSIASLTFTVWQWITQRRNANPFVMVNTREWYGVDADDEYDVLDKIDVDVVNVSTVSVTISSVSAAPVEGMWFSLWSSRHDIVGPRESLQVVLNEGDLRPIYAGADFGHGDQPHEVWMRVTVRGFGRGGQETSWYSSPFLLRRKAGS
jgi:hypothetical protein